MDAQRLHHDARVAGVVADEVAVDAQPVHLAAERDLLLADHRDVVLGDARHHAGAASGAARQVDRHAPAVAGISGPRIRGEQRSAVLGELFPGLLELLDGGGGRDQAPLHRVVLLRLGEACSLADGSDGQAGREPGGVGVAQGAGVESQAPTERLSRAAAAVAERRGDGVLGVPGRDQDRGVRGWPAQPELDAVPLPQAELARGDRRDQRGVLPGELRHRIRQLLQPGDVGEPPVPDAVVRHDVDLEPGTRIRGRHLHGGGKDLVVADGRLLRRGRGAADEPVGQPFLPIEREIVWPLRLPERAQLRVRRAIALAEERRQRLHLARAGIERGDERLDEGDRAVVGARIAPALERVQRGDDPGRAVGGLVEVERSVDGVRHLGERLAEVQIGRGRVDGIPCGDHQGIDLAAAHLLDELLERPRSGVGIVQHGARCRRAGAPERRVDGVRGGMQHGRLARSDGNERAAAGGHQILRHRIGELRALRRQRKTLLQRRVARERRNLRRQPAQQRQPEPVQMRRLQTEAMIGVHPGHRQVRLHRVEARQPPVRRIALLRPVPHGGERPRQGREQIGVEREHHPRPGEIEADLVRRAIRELGAVVDLLQRDRAPGGEFRLRICVGQPLAQPADQRRGGGLHQETQSCAAAVAKRARLLRSRLEEIAPRARLTEVLHDPEALRIVEPQQLGLLQGTDGAAAGRMVGIAFDLRRPALVRGDEQPGGPAVDDRCGRVVQRVPGGHLRRLPGVGKDLLVRRLEAATERRQRSGRPEQLQEAAPRGRVIGRRRGPQLARGSRRRPVLVQAAPELLPLARDRECL